MQGIGFESPVRYGTISISTYPTGQIGYMSAHAKKYNNVAEESVCLSENDESCLEKDMDWSRVFTRFREMDGETLYYHPRIHRR